jgi:hypothetical protein
MAAALSVLLANQAAEGRAPPGWCRTHTERVGPCRQVHGRLGAYNGNPTMRIWIVGTHRMLGVHGRTWQETENGEDLPANVYEYMGANAFGFGPNGFPARVYGAFRICPLNRERPGHMQTVCVDRASGLYRERR